MSSSESLRPAGHEADTVGGDARRAEPVRPERLRGARSDTDEVDVPGVPLEPPGTLSQVLSAGLSERRGRRVTTAPPGILRRVTTSSSNQDQSRQKRKNTNATDPGSPRSLGSGSGEEVYGKKKSLADKSFVSMIVEEQAIEERATNRLGGRRSTTSTVIPPGSLRGCVVGIVRRQAFTAAVSALVLLNAFCIGLETSWNLCSGSQTQTFWYAVEVLFVLAFTVEISLRLFAEQGRFFQETKWNIFDMCLVVSSSIDTLVLRPLLPPETMSVNFIIVLRILRLFRLARIFRLIRFFRELWYLVEGILGAVKTLGWAWLMLFCMIYVPAIFMTRSVGQAHPDNPQLTEMFGTVRQSMFTLFQVMSTEGWSHISRTTMVEDPWTVVFFVAFMGATTFAVMHVVVAVIVQNTLEHASQRSNEEQSRKDSRERAAMKKIINVFMAADVDGDGCITKEEFINSLGNPVVITQLHEVNVDVRQAESLFEILDYDESGSLDATEFVDGVMTARGEAQSKEILSVQCDVWKAERRLLEMIDTFDECLADATDDLVTVVGGLSEEMDDFLGSIPKALSRAIERAAEECGLPDPDPG